MSLFSRTQNTPTEEELLLQKIGLSRQEALLYVTLLAEQSCTVGEISRLTTMHRPTVYRTLPALLAKGLIAKEFRGKRTSYRAESPSQLRPVFEQLTEEIENSLPKIEKTFKNREKRPGIKMLDGKRAIPFLLLDILYTLAEGETYYRYSSVSPSVYHETGNLPRNYKKLRDQKQLKRLVITTKAVAAEHDDSKTRSVKIVPKGYGLFDHNISQFIYGGKVAFVDYTDQIVLLIEHEKIAKFQTQLFKMLFDRL